MFLTKGQASNVRVPLRVDQKGLGAWKGGRR